jgi:hypothetical protein
MITDAQSYNVIALSSGRISDAKAHQTFDPLPSEIQQRWSQVAGTLNLMSRHTEDGVLTDAQIYAVAFVNAEVISADEAKEHIMAMVRTYDRVFWGDICETVNDLLTSTPTYSLDDLEQALKDFRSNHLPAPECFKYQIVGPTQEWLERNWDRLPLEDRISRTAMLLGGPRQSPECDRLITLAYHHLCTKGALQCVTPEEEPEEDRRFGM